MHVSLASRLAALHDRRETPAGVASEDAHQVHDVRAKDHQVLTTPASVFLAVAAQLQEVAEAASSNQLLDSLHPWAVARLMSDRQFDMMHLAGPDHLVRLGESTGHRLFEEDARSPPGAGDDHVPVSVEVAIGDTDD